MAESSKYESDVVQALVGRLSKVTGDFISRGGMVALFPEIFKNQGVLQRLTGIEITGGGRRAHLFGAPLGPHGTMIYGKRLLKNWLEVYLLRRLDIAKKRRERLQTYRCMKGVGRGTKVVVMVQGG